MPQILIAPLAMLVLLIVYGPIARRDMINLWSFWGNADLLSFGCLAALLDQRFSNLDLTKQIAPYLCIFGALIALVTIFWSTVDAAHYLSSSVIAIGAAMFLFGAVNWSMKSRTASLLASPLAGFGRASYEVYLFHVALIVFYRAALAAIGATGLLADILINIIFLAFTLALGLIVSRFFTEPANSAIRKFYSERSHEGIVPAGASPRRSTQPGVTSVTAS
jgi:peptidoglycan/LPS O-acetylase OafA/YrhL